MCALISAVVSLFIPTAGSAAGAASLSVHLPEATATEAAQALAAGAGLACVMADGSEVRRPFRLEDARLGVALEELSRVYDIDVAVWRDILLAEPSQEPGLLSDRLRSALTLEEAELLFRPPDDGSYEAPGFEHVIEAVTGLARHGHTAENRSLLVRAALWRAAPELQQHLENLDACSTGRVLVQVEPVSDKARHAGDPCAEHLRFLYPGSGDPADLLMTQQSTFHGPEHDRFAEALKAERATIGREELVRRAIAQAVQEEDALGRPEAFNLGISVSLDMASLPVVVKALTAQTGLTVAMEPATEAALLTVVSETAQLGDLLQAAARLTGNVVAPEGDGHVVSAAETTLERLETALPLPLWALARATRTEADLWCLDHVRAAWESLTDEMCGSARSGPAAVGSLPPTVGDLGEYDFCRRYRRWTQNLPLRDGPVPLWLYERPDDHRYWAYELRAPGGSEFIKGIGYMLIKAEVRGDPVFRIPCAPDAEEARP
ncbi:MAG: hypothetical protein FJX74_03485 [Armatimonadetes bacterium]|nr:hypothetical protein [Armatimonadota bacterium]